MSKKVVAEHKMNKFGSSQIPFFFIIDFDMQSPIILPLSEVAANGIYFDINGKTNICTQNGSANNSPFVPHPVSYEDYSNGFRQAKEALVRGDSYLLNLTFSTPIESEMTMDDFFFASAAKYRLLVRDIFVVFSPESFIKISGNKISSFPMKGTIDASLPNAASIILSDQKELAEHTTIVDLMRNDLSIVAEKVPEKRFRYNDEIHSSRKNLLQVSSEISGELPAGYENQIGSILFSLLPAGSVTGAPKKRTVEIIHSIETYQRGYYTGVFGYFDGNVLDSGVMIRFIEKTENGLIYKSGGGITVFSDCQKEYQEMIDKVYVPTI